MPHRRRKGSACLACAVRQAACLAALAALATLAALAPATAADPAIAAALQRARAGDLAAQREIASAYYHGDGVAQDRAEAARWLRRASDQGDPESQFELAGLYFRGDGVEASRLQGARWLRRAARGGHAKAAEQFAKIERSGELLGLAKRDPEGVFAVQLEAAEAGDAAAQSMVGEMYRDGVGVKADTAQALHWLELAATAGDRDAQAALGSMYDEGRGVAADPAAALAWFRRAAEAGHAGAQFNLGAMYLNGVGAPADPTEAVMWLSLAAGESASARFLLYTQEQKIAPEALAEGRRRAAARGATLRPITPASPERPAPL
jgi:TPR repeat protein